MDSCLMEKKMYELPEKDYIWPFGPPWEDGFFGLAEVLDSPKSVLSSLTGGNSGVKSHLQYRLSL